MRWVENEVCKLKNKKQQGYNKVPCKKLKINAELETKLYIDIDTKI
jgi:hypothetical protein